MAAFFQSFLGSGMPKRLLRYALSRFDLLDADTLDLDNLDLVLGRKTVFDFRDVGIKLKKLQKLLALPSSFRLVKAKVLRLRVTVPMDIFTSPIIIDIDGVDVRVQILGEHSGLARPHDSLRSEDAPLIVPNTADLAQSFLETESLADKCRMEAALTADSTDLGASVVVSEDGSEDESSFGTGQTLSLPGFLTDFLQGVVDRMQIAIKSVVFQLDLEVPSELGSSKLDPISLQVTLGQIEVEGVTAGNAGPQLGAPSLVHREGKRHVSLSSIRACLISEAQAFTGLTRSPSTTSASLASSTAVTGIPPSRQASFRTQGSLHEQPMTGPQESYRERLSEDAASGSHRYPLDKTEKYSCAYPYYVKLDVRHEEEEKEEDDPDREVEDRGPCTPRASTFLDSHNHAPSDLSFAFEQSNPAASSVDSPSRSSPASSSTGSCAEDLAQGVLYTHEEARSLYMSALSQLAKSETSAARDQSRETKLRESTKVLKSSPIPRGNREQTQSSSSKFDEDFNTRIPPETTEVSAALEHGPVLSNMPGAWGDDADPDLSLLKARPSRPPEIKWDSNESSPAFSMARYEQPESLNDTMDPAGDEPATPKGPPMMVKEIVRLDNISIYIQLPHERMETCPTTPLVGQEQAAGGSFHHARPPGSFPGQISTSAPHARCADREDDKAVTSVSVDVFLSPLSIEFDAPIAFLLAMVVERLLKSVKDERPTQHPQQLSSRQSGSSPAVPKVQIAAEEITVNFVNHVEGVVNQSGSSATSQSPRTAHEVLLNMTLLNLKVSSSPSLPDQNPLPAASGVSSLKKGDFLTKIDLEKFRLGFAKGDIFSFDSTKQMSTSKWDFIPTGHDMCMQILHSGDKTVTFIQTLPLVVRIDLQRLDETLRWFGGLGSFLNMSASMASNSSPTSKPARAKSLPKARGVRFETPMDAPDEANVSHSKINLRVGGVLVELIGKDCSLAAETSALKLVRRAQGIGATCGRLRVSGPYLRSSSADPAVVTEAGGLRVEFLDSPANEDLEKLLELIIPSKVKFDHENDEVMVDTLIRQRRKGSVLRATLEKVKVSVNNVAQLSAIPAFGEELAKLAAVAKYLPEDDRPGLLTLTCVETLSISCDFPENVGHIGCEVRKLEIGQITTPSLVAAAVHQISITRNENEALVGSSIPENTVVESSNGPVMMVRVLGDEIEPIIKIKLEDLRLEYRVMTIMDFLKLGSDTTPQEFEAGLAASVANLGDQAHAAIVKRRPLDVDEKTSSHPNQNTPTKLSISVRNCAVGLNPYGLPSKMIVALTDAHAEAVLPNNGKIELSVAVRKASVLLTDDAEKTLSPGSKAGVSRSRSSSSTSRQIEELCARGFVDICYVSSASIEAFVIPDAVGASQIEITVRDDLLVLETCADSTQTLVTLANALKPPTPPSRENKYRTEIMPIENLLQSINMEAFGKPEGQYDFDQDFAAAQEMGGTFADDDENGSDILYPSDPQFPGPPAQAEELFDAMRSLEVTQNELEASQGELGVSQGELGVFQGELEASQSGLDTDEEFVLLTDSMITGSAASPRYEEGVVDYGGFRGLSSIHENFYGGDAPEPQNAKIWSSASNSYQRAPIHLVDRSPLRVKVRDVHVIWNLYDGYDWVKTRDVISKAVEDIETKATERQSRRGVGPALGEEDEEEEAIGDFLFNSIYIGIAPNRDPRDLTRAINEGLNDTTTTTTTTTETESVATTVMTTNTNRTARRIRADSRKRLRLTRSKRHKMTFELKGINVDMVVFPPDEGETVSSIDARVEDLEIFDHVPTSTWKKFATYDQDHGLREMGASMVRLELLNVRPVPQLAATEIVARATVLPLRLHVDQDALDFITRFFEFKDDEIPVHASRSDVPFLQRAEVMDIPVNLDFKPKRVDYGGLRSGHTTEFMNFVTLEESHMVLRHVIVYGVSGFDRLGTTLNDIWMPDIRNNQLPGVLAGLYPVRPLVNIGSGFRNLVEIPLREYRRDGRVLRGISKGAAAFARETGTELVKLGAKLAIGTQTVLQGAEAMLTNRGMAEEFWEDDDDNDAEERTQVSPYADQPTGVMQGIRGGLRSLVRDVNMARDAIIAIPGEVMATQSATGAAKAVLNRAPTIMFRPAVGVTKAIGQTLMGATNSLDPANRRRIAEKYKHA